MQSVVAGQLARAFRAHSADAAHFMHPDSQTEDKDREMRNLVEAAQAMLKATIHMADQDVVEARIRLAAALKCGDDRHRHDVELADRRTRHMAEYPYPMGPVD